MIRGLSSRSSSAACSSPLLVPCHGSPHPALLHHCCCCCCALIAITLLLLLLLRRKAFSSTSLVHLFWGTSVFLFRISSPFTPTVFLFFLAAATTTTTTTIDENSGWLVLSGLMVNRRRKRQGNCAYATAANVQYTSEPLDVVAEVKSQKILVLGGSGFVGTAICKAAVAHDIEVTSLSRSGRPSYLDPWLDRVTWISGDVFTTDLDALLDGVSAVVSTLGGFGSNEQMEKINAEANILAVNAAKRAGVPRYIYISVHEYNLPTFALNNGYFSGKKKAEAEVFSLYPNSGTVLQPGFMYGKRKVNGVDIPLGWVGEPLKKLLAATSAFTRPLKNLPASDLILAPPVSVDDVANAVVKAVSDNDIFGTFNIEQIVSMAKD